ncbi:MAG: hypothetical protein DRI86_03815 [Bacteroidetes bacterium]|nr:MAG: hypothetical protein DRI86_03815 [Bacteroidota bacterium]
MILRIFNNKNRLLQFFLIAIVFSSFFFLPISIVPSKGFNPLYDLFLNIIGNNPITIRIVFILLITIPIILTQYFAVLFGIIQRNYFHFFFLAPILIFSNSIAWTINPLLFALLFFVLGIANLFQLNRTESPIVISSTAFIFSIASLFYSIFIWNILLIIIALLIFREFKLRELMMAIGSFVLPYIYIFTWYFVDDILLIKWHEFINQLFDFSFNITLDNNYLQLVYIAVIILLALYLIISTFNSMQNKLIQIREYISFLLVTFIFSIILLLFAGSNTPYQFMSIQFLVAFLYSIHLSDNRPNWYHDIVILLLISHNIILIFYA